MKDREVYWAVPLLSGTLTYFKGEEYPRFNRYGPFFGHRPIYKINVYFKENS